MKAFLAVSFICLGYLAAAHAHVPVPDGVLHPQSAAEAWNILRLSTANVERLLQENRLAEIPDQISLCSPALRTLPGFVAAPADQDAVKTNVIRASTTINSLAQAGLAGDHDLAGRAQEMLHAVLQETATHFDARTVNADIFVCPMHPDFIRADASARCDKCGMPLIMRRIPYSFFYTAPGEPTLRLTATTKPLHATQISSITVHLAHTNGTPVTLDQLLVIHTQPIHLLIVDASLQDYHHEHPKQTSVPGDYHFSFTPTKSGCYRVFADVVPAETGVQEYSFVDLPVAASDAQPIDKTTATDTTVGSLRFHLDATSGDGSPPRANQAQTLRVTVTTSDGQPMTKLEPVMAAFAHLVGFYDDGRTVVHLHPAGAEATDSKLHGGPALEFKFYPPKAGFLKIYCQVQVDGEQIFAPFAVTVLP